MAIYFEVPMETQRSKGTRSRLAIMTIAASIGVAQFSPARAESAPAYITLFRQAEMAAPRLQESDANIRVAEGLNIQAAVRPNPSVSLEAENIAGSYPYNGLSRSQTTLSYNQPLEIGGQRTARIAAAGAGIN